MQAAPKGHFPLKAPFESQSETAQSPPFQGRHMAKPEHPVKSLHSLPINFAPARAQARIVSKLLHSNSGGLHWLLEAHTGPTQWLRDGFGPGIGQKNLSGHKFFSQKKPSLF